MLSEAELAHGREQIANGSDLDFPGEVREQGIDACYRWSAARNYPGSFSRLETLDGWDLRLKAVVAVRVLPVLNQSQHRSY